MVPLTRLNGLNRARLTDLLRVLEPALLDSYELQVHLTKRVMVSVLDSMQQRRPDCLNVVDGVVMARLEARSALSVQGLPAGAGVSFTEYVLNSYSLEILSSIWNLIMEGPTVPAEKNLLVNSILWYQTEHEGVAFTLGGNVDFVQFPSGTVLSPSGHRLTTFDEMDAELAERQIVVSLRLGSGRRRNHTLPEGGTLEYLIQQTQRGTDNWAWSVNGTRIMNSDYVLRNGDAVTGVPRTAKGRKIVPSQPGIGMPVEIAGPVQRSDIEVRTTKLEFE